MRIDIRGGDHYPKKMPVRVGTGPKFSGFSRTNNGKYGLGEGTKLVSAKRMYGRGKKFSGFSPMKEGAKATSPSARGKASVSSASNYVGGVRGDVHAKKGYGV